MTEPQTLELAQPANAAQALYLPWLKAKIDSLSRPDHGGGLRGTPPRKRRITERAAGKSVAREIERQRRKHLEGGGSYRTFVLEFPQ